MKPSESHQGLKHMGPQLDLISCVSALHTLLKTTTPASLALFLGKGGFSGAEGYLGSTKA